MIRQRHDAWDAAMDTIKTLRAAGHVALLAGGCVRDRLLSQTPKDYDVATDATPERIKAIFPRARRVGAKFGVMLVRKFGHDIEVATFRADGPYSDGRHPDDVRFGTDREDAHRRDFTINGLFLDPLGERLIDYVGGQADLAGRVLRTIGDPDRRFAEDHLRMLRAVRFAARFGLKVEPATMAAIRRHAHHLGTISVERIWIELEQILTAPSRARGWALLLETGLRQHLAKRWPQDAGEDQLIQKRLSFLPPSPVDAALALAACWAGRSPAEVELLARALRLSGRLTKAVVGLVLSLPQLRNGPALQLAELKLLMDQEYWEGSLELLRVDLAATGADLGPYRLACARAARVAPEEIAPPPLLTGRNLCELGLMPGPQFGTLLDAVYRAQLNGQIATRTEALALVQRLIQ